jgi:hypothetical protein
MPPVLPACANPLRPRRAPTQRATNYGMGVWCCGVDVLWNAKETGVNGSGAIHGRPVVN